MLALNSKACFRIIMSHTSLFTIMSDLSSGLLVPDAWESQIDYRRLMLMLLTISVWYTRSPVVLSPLSPVNTKMENYQSVKFILPSNNLITVTKMRQKCPQRTKDGGYQEPKSHIFYNSSKLHFWPQHRIHLYKVLVLKWMFHYILFDFKE